MQNELGRCSSNTLPVRNMVERPLQLGMLLNVFADFLHALAGGLKALFELCLGFHLRLSQGHLDTAVRVDLTLSGAFDREEDHVLELVLDCRLDAIGLRRGHAAEWLARRNQVATPCTG